MTINDRDHRLKLTAAEEENQRLKQRHNEELREQEMKTNRDLQRMKETHLSDQQTLKEQMTKLESIRTSLERVKLSARCFVRL